ncbi:MAG: zf-HC2 domain-containing protein [Sarcina sp.]
MSKLSCDVIKDLISLYIDDLLSDDSKNIVDEHIKTCETCKLYLEEISEPIEILETEALTNKNDMAQVKLIKKIKRNSNSKMLITSAIVGLIAILLTSDQWIFKGFLILPIFGAFVYFKSKSLLLAPTIIFLLKTITIAFGPYQSYLDMSVLEFVQMIGSILGIGLLFATFPFIGSIIGLLIQKIFIDD